MLPSAVGGWEGTDPSLSWSFGGWGNPGTMHTACTQLGGEHPGKAQTGLPGGVGRAGEGPHHVYLATHSEQCVSPLAENKSLLLSDLEALLG